MSPLRIKYIGFDKGNPGFKNTDVVTQFFKEGDIVVENIHDANTLIVGNFIQPHELQQIMGCSKCVVLYIAEPILKFKMCYFAGELYKRGHYNYIFGCVDNNPISRVKFPLYYTSFNHNPDVFINTNNYVKMQDISSKNFATLISRHDAGNIRVYIHRILSKLGHISCPGPLLNNCSNEEVNRIGNPEYIKKFIFNICPENYGASHPGYITEKLMNSCLGGAIPIYYGVLDDMDKCIFNNDRIIFVDPSNLMSLYNTVKDLLTNPNKLEEFYKQDVFMPGAFEVMNSEMHQHMTNMMDDIRKKTR
jgi:hypothetical protein